MGATTLTNARVLYGAYDLSPFTGELDTTAETAMRTMNNIGADGYRIQYPSIMSARATLKGWSDYAAGAVNAAFMDAVRGRQDAFTVIPRGTHAAVGDAAIFTHNSSAD